MTNRYVTEAEKIGTRARQADYRQRLVTEGRGRREFILTDLEAEKVKDLIREIRQADIRNTIL
jgi:hypothetical protein